MHLKVPGLHSPTLEPHAPPSQPFTMPLQLSIVPSQSSSRPLQTSGVPPVAPTQAIAPPWHFVTPFLQVKNR